MTRRILVVEDSEELAQLLTLHLSDLDVTVDIATDGRQGLDRAAAGDYDLVVLDLILPALDGLEVCRRLRAHGIFTPILMLTSKASELDRVRGLSVGADDYLTKPFGIAELQARVKAMLRRRGVYDATPDTRQHLTIGAIAIDLPARTVKIAGHEIGLTAREYDLLLHFVRAPGRVFSRAELLDFVWGHSSDAFEHTVNSHINRLRAKIEQDPAAPRLIVTVWGVGYKFDAEAADRGA